MAVATDVAESSSEMTQSTLTTTLSICGTRPWNRRETTQHRPRALTSPILLKTISSRESGKRSKWSMNPSIRSSSVSSGQILLLDRSGLNEDIFKSNEGKKKTMVFFGKRGREGERR